MGIEEKFIEEAIALARGLGIEATGPLPRRHPSFTTETAMPTLPCTTTRGSFP